MRYPEEKTRALIEGNTNLTVTSVLEQGEKDGLWTFGVVAPVAPYKFTLEAIETPQKIILQIHEVKAGYTIQKKEPL